MEGLYITLWNLCMIAMMYGQCHGHGYLKTPPSRSSMWRYGFHTPINYDDNQLFCGGFDVQWNRNGGKCGICGDRWDGPRDNEAGGKYATGTISRQYHEGQTINVEVKLTVQHGGYFEFRICPNNDPSRRTTQQCLDRFLLRQPDGNTRFYPIGGTKTYSVKLVLPSGLTCTQCVFQWIWNTASNWGCGAGKCDKGLGPQEQFRGCADVSITKNTVNGEFQTNTQQSGSNSQSGNVNLLGTVVHNFPQSNNQNSLTNMPGSLGSGSNTEDCRATELYRAKFPYADKFCVTQCKAGQCLSEYFCTAACKNLNQVSNSQKVCDATPQFKSTYPQATQFCIKYCKSGQCPTQYCTDACRHTS